MVDDEAAAAAADRKQGPVLNFFHVVVMNITEGRGAKENVSFAVRLGMPRRMVLLVITTNDSPGHSFFLPLFESRPALLSLPLKLAVHSFSSNSREALPAWTHP